VELAEFDYDLPPGLIAQAPAPSRDASRLLVVDRARGAFEDHAFHELPDLLRPGDCMVVNNSRVIPARVLARDTSGRPVELLFFAHEDERRWRALVRPGRRCPVGAELSVAGGGGARLRIVGVDADGPRLVERLDGTIEDLMRERGLEIHELTLHVGPGTFRPITAATIEDHVLPPERVSIPGAVADGVNRARTEGRRVLAVGTTTTRALESAARPDGHVRPFEGEAGAYITPGYRFRVVDALLTNFHLPRSSLLVLVAAFAGRELIVKSYAHAVRAGYRFYSYGDAMLIL
jgi:S-adenosylmethionine:tRNA ribosyltransferase-isomerase